MYSSRHVIIIRLCPDEGVIKVRLSSICILVVACMIVGLPPVMSANKDSSLSPAAALSQLKAGNARYLDGVSKHPRIDPARRLKTAKQGQTPIASILSCADARVPVESVFDKGFGDLFVVRVAGNVCEMAELASIEYGVIYLKTPLIVVLGHSKCGAVQAAIAGGDDLEGQIPLLLKEIRPAVETVHQNHPGLKGERLEDAAIEQNVRRSIERILESPGLRKAVEEKKVMIVGAIRDLKSGKVRWLD